jgi:NADH-quinone oxidoreductase subunit J
MVDQIAFGVIAAVLLFGALRVVTAKNLVHAVLWLGVTLTATALLFVTLQAAFLAGIQLLLYTGGVITLMLFGVMLTRRHETPDVENEGSPRRRLPGFIVAAVLLGMLVWTVRSTDGLPTDQTAPMGTAEIGRAFLTDHLLAFEVLSLLLLAAMIGAIVVARRRDYGLEGVAPMRAEVAPVPTPAPAPEAEPDSEPEAAAALTAEPEKEPA